MILTGTARSRLRLLTPQQPHPAPSLRSPPSWLAREEPGSYAAPPLAGARARMLADSDNPRRVLCPDLERGEGGGGVRRQGWGAPSSRDPLEAGAGRACRPAEPARRPCLQGLVRGGGPATVTPTHNAWARNGKAVSGCQHGAARARRPRRLGPGRGRVSSSPPSPLAPASLAVAVCLSTLRSCGCEGKDDFSRVNTVGPGPRYTRPTRPARLPPGRLGRTFRLVSSLCRGPVRPDS